MITFDPLSQYKPLAGERVMHDPGELKEFLRGNRWHSFNVLYQPRTGSVIENWKHVGQLAYSRGNMLLCIDEVGMLTENGQFVPETKGQEPILKTIVHYGRHRKLDVICTAQRPVNVPRSYTAMCSEVRIFQTSENRDLTYLQERVGESSTAQLPGLPKFHFLLWTDEGVAIYRRRLTR